MVTITIDNALSVQHGGITLTGTAPTAGIMQWWLNDESQFRTSGFTREGIGWQLDMPLQGNSFIINIRYLENAVASNVVSYVFSSEAQDPEVSFQFNEFDDLALLNDVNRIPGETNSNIRERSIDSYRAFGNSTLEGQINGIHRDLDLPTLNPFFFLSVRYNPLTDKHYKNAYISTSSLSAEFQVLDWVVYDELLDIDPVSSIGIPKKTLGHELAETEVKLQIFNAGQLVPDAAIKILEDNKIWIDDRIVDLDFSKQVKITYPYKETFDYIYYDETSKTKKERTVLEFKQWLESLATVEDEYENNVPLVVWNEGQLRNVQLTPDASLVDQRQSLEDAINRPPSKEFVNIASFQTNSYYRYENPYPAKGFFKASQIVPVKLQRLETDPQLWRGSWASLNYFSDDEFKDKLIPEVYHKNLRYYADILRRITRMEMRNSVVNYDYWGSDSPRYIGDNFIPSRRDSGLVDHTILTDEGSTQPLSLNSRKYYSRKLHIMHR